MNTTNLNELHGLLAIVQSIDVGVVVLDRDYSVEVWNTFMENRSGLLPSQVRKRSFFELFPEVDEDWFRRKVESVTTLGTPSFTIWEQRPYLLRFKNYQPITGLEDFMYQNTTLLPLKGIDGRIDQVCLIIYDVTDVAINRRQLQAANAELQRLSSTDRLTGLYNRGHWEEMLRLDYARHRRYDSQAALVMFDIDHFKAINDNYGHQAGDAVIQQVAGLIRENLRDSDVAGRYGGEEFVVLLPDTDKEGALMFAERLRYVVEACEVRHEQHRIRFTISLGVADLSAPSNGHAQLIEWADSALYASKSAGRNRVTLHQL
ncbi:sensor domain-containing diguanylate cyclase [Stutzerimonas nitrititolerans]|uniref:sensor domain-containing diguanylate cyclase n=1 Tax=Stutzerimonas nitrititolerans TaxID=2482751 RepID=UPI0028AACFB7|nr:diguanylate cyclase [Stutzerimonas nitrititolerans]